MDESRRRENAIARELTRAFPAETAEHHAGNHLDGEIAAAWMEQGLDAGARARAEAHLADCAQCQALIATLSRISPPVGVTAGGSWWHWLRTPWLVPAAAATVAVAIWVVLPSQNPPAAPESVQARLEDRAGSPSPNAETPATPEAPAIALPAAPRAVSPEARPAPDRGAPGARRVEKAEQERAEPKEFARAAPPSASPAQDLRKSTVASEAPAAPARERQEAADTLAGAAAAAPAAPPAPAAVTNGALTQEAARTAAGTAAEARADRAQARSAFATAPRLVVMTADGSGRWRIAAGRIQYAARNGAPWISAAALDPSGLTAGAAPGGLVCWLVGRTGTVLLTTDAVRFSRLTAPAATDLIAVRASDARTATVTAADGRRFTTTDQGASWTLVPR